MQNDIHITVKIKRQEGPGEKSYFQSFDCAGDGELTVADLLRSLNEQEEIKDASGEIADPVGWECSCLEKKCGACAMLINGRPALACGVFLKIAASEPSKRGFRKRGEVVLEPLSRFPVVRDLMVDRSSMFEMLNKMKLWLEEKDWAGFNRDEKLEFSSGQCLMCGCCLEVCPNFIADGGFGGAAAMNAAFKMLGQQTRDSHFHEMAAEYRKHFFNGCGQSFSCQAVCPAKLPLDEIQARANNYAARKL